MGQISWISNGGGDWATAADWSGGAVPGAADAVTLATSSPVTITFSTIDKIASLQSTDDLLSIGGGALTVTGITDLAGGLAETGGTLALGDAVNKISGGATISTGDLSLATGATLNLAGSGDLGSTISSYGAHIYGAGTLVSSGIVTIEQNGGTGELTLGDGLKWINTGTVVQAGIVDAGYNGGIAFTINNQAGAVFDFTTDIACLMNMQITNGQGDEVTASSNLNNAGLIEKTGGLGDTTVYSTIDSTGTISVETGRIVLEDGGLVKGHVIGAGVLEIAGGGTLSGVLATIQQIDVSGGDLILTGSTLSGLLTDEGQIEQTGGFTLHSGSVFGEIYITGTYDIDNNVSIHGAGGSIVIDGGILDKTGGAGAVGGNIAAAITDDGTIVVADGILRLGNALTGTGGVIIGSGDELVAQASVGSGIIVTLGTSGELKLSQPADFDGTISNFVSGDKLDIAATITSATINADGTLVLKDHGVTVASLLTTGSNSNDVFSYGTDGSGGTLLKITGPDEPAAISMSAARPSFISTAVPSAVPPPIAPADAALDQFVFAAHAHENSTASPAAALFSGLIDLSGTHLPLAGLHVPQHGL